MVLLEFVVNILYNNIVNNDIDNNKERNMSDINFLLEQAIAETDNLNAGEIFLVKDLFKGYIWNRIPRNTRLLLGTLFLNAVNNDQNLKIEVAEKTSSNQQKYKKQ